jgi:hypothetical protein
VPERSPLIALSGYPHTCGTKIASDLPRLSRRGFLFAVAGGGRRPGARLQAKAPAALDVNRVLSRVCQIAAA